MLSNSYLRRHLHPAGPAGTVDRDLPYIHKSKLEDVGTGSGFELQEINISPNYVSFKLFKLLKRTDHARIVTASQKYRT
jgi:hypothetical protein